MNDKLLKNEVKFNNIFEKIDVCTLENLKIEKKFKKQGKQGVVGIFRINNTKRKCVYKISQSINYLIKHEALIMKSLFNIKEFCPHFCKLYKTIKPKVDINYKNKANTFDITSKHPIEVDVLLMEYIPAKKMEYLIRNKDIDDMILYSSIKQILLALSIAQKKLNFTHYDLHSCNILENKCDKDTVFVYILDENNIFCIPTHGYYPQIIDFGFSYTKDMENKSLLSSLAHTNVGFTTNQCDNIADTKLFLVTVSDELKIHRKGKRSNKMRNIIKNVFKPLDINWDSGWDNYTKYRNNGSDCISEAINEIPTKSCLFKKYDYLCIDVLQTLITLPLEKRSLNKLEVSYKLFIREFEKIEHDINNTLKSLYIFKCIVSSAKKLYNMYMDVNSRKNAIKMFTEYTLDSIRSIADFCYPKGVLYEKLLCGLYVFSEACETLLYNCVEKKNKDKGKQYSKLELKTPVQIYGAIEVNIPCNYVYNKNTKFYIFDSVKEQREIHQNVSDNVISLLNKTNSLMRGSIVYDYLYKKIDTTSDDSDIDSDDFTVSDVSTPNTESLSDIE
tara:strand:- start:790 stop:2466 length:1677 start_codon:yes stop_codon:yes gene_type:complete